MKKNIIEIKVNENGDQYVGLNIKKNKIYLYLPIGYNCKYKDRELFVNELPKELKQEIMTIMLFLSKKHKIKQDKSTDESDFDFLSAINVVNNYINYGTYKESELKTKNNYKGRINWKKTIHQNQTYIDNKIIYNNIISEHIDYKCEKIIKEIQEICLYSISKTIGPLIGFKYPKNISRLNKIEMIKTLKEELKNTNEDIKKEIITNLLNYINNTKFEALENGNIAIKYKEFQHIYENLIDYYGIKDKTEFYPKSKYLLWKNNELYKICPPSQPDTIILNNQNLPKLKNTAFILDSKYRGDLPNEYDIFKQIRYKQYFKTKISKKYNKIYNVFVLPKNLQIENKIINIEKYYATSEDYEKKEKIYIAYVDTKELITNPQETMKKLLYDIDSFKP